MLYLPRNHTNHSMEGQGLIEYALILVLVSIVVIVVQMTLADSIGDVYQEIANAMTYSRNQAGSN